MDGIESGEYVIMVTHIPLHSMKVFFPVQCVLCGEVKFRVSALLWLNYKSVVLG